jgi:hypothetical protein
VQAGQAILSAGGAVLFVVLLRSRGQLSMLHSLQWGLLFGFSAGYSSIAREAESYNAAIVLYLAALLLLSPSAGVRSSRFWIAIAVYCLAVCIHQKLALASIAYFFYYWQPFNRVRRDSLIFIGISGIICLATYFAMYQSQSISAGFVRWITLYSGSMPAFGHWSNFVSMEQVHRLVANLMAALVIDPVALMKAAGGQAGPGVKLLMLVGYGLWAGVMLGAMYGIRSPLPLLRFFSAWFLTFELFLWYWAPGLLQMQVLSLPAAIGIFAILSQRIINHYPGRAASRITTLVLALALGTTIVTTRIASPPKLGAFTLKEAKAFYRLNALIGGNSSWSMLIYSYSKSNPYIVVPGPLAADNFAIIRNGDAPEERQAQARHALSTGLACLRHGRPLVIHQSLLLSEEGASIIDALNQELFANLQPFKVDVLYAANHSPVAVAITRAEDDRKTGPPVVDRMQKALYTIAPD